MLIQYQKQEYLLKSVQGLFSESKTFTKADKQIRHTPGIPLRLKLCTKN